MNKVIAHVQKWSDDLFEVIFTDNTTAEIHESKWFGAMFNELSKFPTFKVQNYLNKLEIPVRITMGSNTIITMDICYEKNFELKDEIMAISVMVLEF